MLAITVLIGAVCSNLRFSRLSEDGFQAQCAADSAIAQAIERLVNKQDFGTHQESLAFPPQPSATPSALLTFSSAAASSSKQPCSFNNFASGTPNAPPGGGPQVAANCAWLVARGNCNGVPRTQQAMVFLPNYFPYVMASSGPIDNQNGGLVVARVAGTYNLANLPNIATAQLLPGDLGSLSAAGTAVHLGPNSLITGNVSSNGGIILGGATVLGSVNPSSNPPGLPQLSFSDPTANEPGVVTLGSSVSSPSLSGFDSAPNGLTVTQGDLALDDAILYVKGDLDIQNGGISGIGALYVDGNVNVTQMAQLQASSQQVLFCTGDVTLGGAGKSQSAFSGIVYTQGSFSASDLTLCGTFINNSSNPSATMTLTDCAATLVPPLQQMSIVVTVTIPAPPPPPNPPAPPAIGPPSVFVQPGGYGTCNTPVTDPNSAQTLTQAYQHNGGTAYSITAYTPGNPPTMTLTALDGSKISGTPAQVAQGLEAATGFPNVTPTQQQIDQVAAMQPPPLGGGGSTGGGSTGGGGGSSSSSTITLSIPWSIDLSQFVAPADRLRLMLWRAYP